MSDRRGDWFLSFKGRQLWPCDLRPEEIDIEEIAHGLSMICRFGAQCSAFYSVAQHSVLVAEQLPDHLKLCGLLHDATEAYLGDMIRPLKRLPEMAGYSAFERRAWEVIAVRFGLPVEMPPEVKEADNRMLITERRDLLPEHPWPWKEDELCHATYDLRVTPWLPARAESEFLALFHRLTTPEPTLTEIAHRVAAHLRRFEEDPAINAARTGSRLKPYFNTAAWRAGSRLGVRYVSFQGSWNLTKAEAVAYLTLLDAGAVGTHLEVLKRA